MTDGALPVTTNPFPAEAVATFGDTLQTCATLDYMEQVEEHLRSYLKGFAVAPDDAGAAISIQGDYGAGKTHTLGWLARLLQERKSLKCASVYVKCNTPRFFDIYEQILRQIPRDRLIELIQLALLDLARRKVRSAKITESVADRLQEPGALLRLDEERNIDIEQLRQELIDDLNGHTVAPREMAQLLLDLPSSTLGAGAYGWLTGRSHDEFPKLGMSTSLIQTNAAVDSRADPDQAVIPALELIARLHLRAGVPLMVLVDQLEVLLRDFADGAIVRVGALLRNFVELLKRQGALVVFAGSPKGWEQLPSDVPPRFRTREPISVGKLGKEEVAALLQAYKAPTAIVNLADEIYALSSGSPREVLRIAHHAFEILDEAGPRPFAPDDLVTAAAQSGSIIDQSKTALSIVDETLGPMGGLVSDVRVGDVQIDRLLSTVSGRPSLAVVVVKVTDSLNEIDWYRRLAELNTVLPGIWPGVRSVAVLVGYSSREAGEKFTLGETIRFDRSNLGSILKTYAIQALSSPLQVDSKQLAESRSEFKAITERLNQLEAERLREREEVASRFATASADLSSELVLNRRLQARIEIEDALDSLRRAMEVHDNESERRLLRTILIANETYFHSDALEGLAVLYRDLINFPRQYGQDVGDKQSRRAVLQAMFEELSHRPSPFQTILRNSIFWWVIGTFAFFALPGIVSMTLLHGTLDWSNIVLFKGPLGPIFSLQLLSLVSAVVALSMLFVGGLGRQQILRRRRLANKRILGLREDFERRTKGSTSIHDSYPQA